MSVVGAVQGKNSKNVIVFGMRRSLTLLVKFKIQITRYSGARGVACIPRLPRKTVVAM